MVQATMTIYKAAVENFLPTPSKSHYLYLSISFSACFFPLLVSSLSLFHHYIGNLLASDEVFRDSSVAKEAACNAGDLGLIPGSRRSSGEGIGYPLQYSWTSLVAQLVKNPLAMWET